MLRRRPTSISLSPRDVTEHLENIERKKRRDRERLQRAQGHKASSVPSAAAAHELTDSLAEQLEENGKNKITCHEYGKINLTSSLLGGASPFRFPSDIGEEGSCKAGGNNLDTSRLDRGELPTVVANCDSTVKDDLRLMKPDDFVKRVEERLESCQIDSSPKVSKASSNTFDDGGFVDTNTEHSSSFIQQNVSTPRNNEVAPGHGLRYRIPLPISPFLIAQGAHSQERRLTTSLTPRVASYGTPGLLLSQPARRPRNYRPRTISYSFEESERASAAYEHGQGSENNSTEVQFPPESRRSLQEELEVGSPDSASSKGNVPSSPPDFAVTSLSKIFPNTPGAEKNQRTSSTSPQLPLPLPFSAVRRNTSLTASLPSAYMDARQSGSASSIYDLPRLQASPVGSSNVLSYKEEEGVEHEEEEEEEGLRARSSSVLRNLAALPVRLLSAYRSRSPFATRYDGAASGRVSPMLDRPQSPESEEAPLTSIRQQFQIYDDNMSPTSQPQTPQHLPEARHQSRFHPSYTAPARAGVHSPRGRGSRSERIVRRATRSDSPSGMDTPGFQGLYGGQENTEDDVLFDRASQRLWALASARRHGRSMSNTPEREPSFAWGRGDEDMDIIR